MQKSHILAAARLAVVAALLTIVSCKKDQAPTETAMSADQETVSPEVMRYLHEAGFDTTIKVAAQNGRFIVEGDIALKQSIVFEDLRRRKAGGTENQRHSYQSLISGDANCNINVVVTGNLRTNAAWMQSIRWGISQWNVLLNCRINFILDESRTPDGVWEDLVITDGDLSSVGAFGMGDWPAFGAVGDLLQIDMNAVANAGSTWGEYSGKRTFLIMHELGHNLGLRHADIANPDNAIPGTPVLDPNSVMNSGGNNIEFDHFSEYDRIAASYLYPVTGNSVLTNAIYGPSVVPYGAPFYQHFAAAIYGDNFYTWTLLDANQQHLHTFFEEEQDGRVLTWSLTVNANPLPVGQYYLRCTVTGADYTASPALFPFTIQ
ncbi:M57 family metalloprotease [Chitinophaga sp. 22620]|uniref:M57 family metalloprotease n=1 Tax=Chitinophaga sp. 22620 TaxID=3453952 RepID=UPI003F8283F3